MLSPCLEVASVRRRAVRHACEGWRLSSERERNDRGRSPAWVWKARIAFPTRKSCINFGCRDRSSHRPRRTYVELAKAHAYDRLGRHPTANLAHQEQTSAKSAKYGALLGHQQDKRVEIATGQLYRPAVIEQTAIRSIQNEAVETINASHVFQDFLTGRSGLSPPTPSPFKPHPSWKRRQ